MNNSQMRMSRGFVRFLFVCVLLWLGLYYFVFPHLVGSGPAKVSLAHYAETQLHLSMESYKREFGNYPTGGNASIVPRILAGENPRKMRLFELSANSTNENGELVDPWDTPYKVVFDGTNNFTIISAGMNRVFGDPDDIIYNNAPNSL